jgi:hypothetical protein
VIVALLAALLLAAEPEPPPRDPSPVKPDGKAERRTPGAEKAPEPCGEDEAMLKDLAVLEQLELLENLELFGSGE